MKHVYAMRRTDGTVKVGISELPSRRAESLRFEWRQAVEILYLTSLRPDARQVEIMAHKILAPKQQRGEWFNVTQCEAIEAIETAIKIADGEIPDITVGMKFVRRTIPPNPKKDIPRMWITFSADVGKELRRFAKKDNRSIPNAVEHLVIEELKRLDYLTISGKLGPAAKRVLGDE